MKVLETGSNGRVDSFKVAQPLARGDTVRGFDLTAAGSNAKGYDQVVGALDNMDAATRATLGVDSVLHLAARMAWLPSDWASMFAANVDGTRVLLDAAANANVKRFVIASSGEAAATLTARRVT